MCSRRVAVVEIAAGPSGSGVFAVASQTWVVGVVLRADVGAG